MTAQNIDKNLLKSALEEMLEERNPALQGVIEELLVKILMVQHHSDRKQPLDMQDIRRRYGLRKEAFLPLNEIFKDAPPASEMIKMLRK
jgi:hypothetical protein